MFHIKHRNRVVDKHEARKMPLAGRLALEATITDERSQQISIAEFDRKIVTDLAEYAARQPWRSYLFDYLGDLKGKQVLDICCGYSMTPVIMALAGATVHAVDVAPITIDAVNRFASHKGVKDRVFTYVKPVEELPFADNTFDLIFGGAALHHLQLDLAGPELARVLKPGGRAAFQEPLAHNRLLEWARDYLPYRNRHAAKGTDRPMTVEEIGEFGRNFTTCTWQGFDLATMLCKLLAIPQTSVVGRRLGHIDRGIFTLIPYAQRFARFAVICVSK